MFKLSSFITITTTTALLLSFGTAANAQPSPLPGGENLTLRDPSIIYNEKSQSYFLFSTGNNFSIYKSGSLEGPWNLSGSVLPNCSNIPIADHCQNTWAPDISAVNNTYVMYYALSESTGSAIGVATSDTMEVGTWTDHGEVIGSSPSSNFNTIDPNLIQVNGSLVLTFGSWRDGIFNTNMTNITTPENNATQKQHLAGGDNHPSEGGFMYHKNDSYYLFFSYGITSPLDPNNLPPPGQEYKVLVGRSPTPTGPFTDKSGKSLTDIGQNVTDQPGTVVLSSHGNVYAPGGQSVYSDPKTGRDVMVYHYVRKDQLNQTTAAVLGINYLDFSSGWPVVVA